MTLFLVLLEDSKLIGYQIAQLFHTRVNLGENLTLDVTMSDITINICAPEENPEMSSPKKWKRKDKWFRGKKQKVGNRGSFHGTHNNQPSYDWFHHMPGQNWPNHQTHRPSTQDGPVTARASHCPPRPSALTHSMPSLTVTVNNNRNHEKPNAQPSVAGPSGSGCSRLVTSSAGISARYLAIDCEMVGTGPKGRISQLARCSIVSYEGDVVYDKFINPSMPVTDYRTRWSGIKRSDLMNATPFSQAKKEILKLLMGKVVIGHAIHNDFKALTYCHPAALTRDTSRIPLLNHKAGFPEAQCASLKRLTKAIFNRDIQTGRKGHSSVEDAKATMELYKVVEEEWERKLAADSQAM